MPKRELPEPPMASLSTWDFLLRMLLTGVVVFFFSWEFDAVREPDRYRGLETDPPTFPPITGWDVFLALLIPMVFLWLRWAWKPRRKHARWHRWLASLAAVFYPNVLFLLVGIGCWNILLNHPWNWVVNSVFVILFIVAWTLPLLSYSAAKRIARAQETLDLRMLSCGGVGSLMVLAGILGASFGMHAVRNGETTSALLVMGLLSPLVTLSIAQHSAEHFWSYRPWAKEEE